MIAFAVYVLAGLMVGQTAIPIILFWLTCEVALIFSGVLFGRRGVRSWQGKVGLFGSALLVMVVIWSVGLIIHIAVS
ncbi:MAG: hypothetical protein JWQ02_2053 [Capsulimonas sp.]|nr:hypothetical protein [Capsulimonas sp.]